MMRMLRSLWRQTKLLQLAAKTDPLVQQTLPHNKVARYCIDPMTSPPPLLVPTHSLVLQDLLAPDSLTVGGPDKQFLFARVYVTLFRKFGIYNFTFPVSSGGPSTGLKASTN